MTETVIVHVDGIQLRGAARPEFADRIREVIEMFRHQRTELRAESLVHVGWGPIVLRSDEPGVFTLTTPDYLGYPQWGMVDDLTFALELFGAQEALLARAAVAYPTPLYFEDDIIVARRALDAPRWTMSRNPPHSGPRNRDSGWYMDVYPTPPGPALAPSEMTRYRAADLLRLKPGAVPALFLPPGVGAVVGDEVEVVLRESDYSILWQKTAGASADAGPAAAQTPSASDADHDRLGEVGRRLFDVLRPQAELKLIPLSEGLGVCLVDTSRGGGKIYVAPDETVLFVASALDFEAGLAAFREGRRTPREAFDPSRRQGDGTSGR
jgi:hypothetical protein